MSELDFDELDKAVNTLMSGVPKVEPPKTDDIKTLTIKPTLPDSKSLSLNGLDTTLEKDVGTDSAVVVATAPAKTTTSTPASSLAARRGGRFMDVVHPSSDMKSISGPSPRATSRQGVTIQPVQKDPADAPIITEDVVEVTATVETTVEAAPAVVVETKSNDDITHKQDTDSQTNDWPDPLEMSGYDSGADRAKSSEPIKVANDADVFTVDESEPDTVRPLESPFLADTKVEKRPLGGIVNKDKTPAEEPNHAPVLGALMTEDMNADDANSQLPAEPDTVDRPLPPELHSDLMAIETDGDTVSTASSDVKVDDSVQASGDTTEKPAVPVAIATKTIATQTTIGSTSISQQYKEEPTTSDQSNGSIYDTDSYHQPIVHPMKNKSGWLWVVWILLLLLVGGGAAMALYMLDII